MRHLQIRDLWIQKEVEDRRIEVLKVAGSENPADLLTKTLGIKDVLSRVNRMNIALDVPAGTRALSCVCPFCVYQPNGRLDTCVADRECWMCDLGIPWEDESPQDELACILNSDWRQPKLKTVRWADLEE